MTIITSMAFIKINDIFDELVDENKKLNECLNVFIKFKSFIDLVSNQLRNNLDSNLIKTYDNLLIEVDDVFKRNDIKFSIDENPYNSRKIIESVEIKQQSDNTNKRKSKSNVTAIKRSRIEYTMDDNQKYVCNYVGCGSRLGSKNSLREHHKIHTGQSKPYSCDFEGCLFSTNKRLFLLNHINGHKGIKPYDCKDCGKCFSSQQTLKLHFDYSHKLLDKPLVCEFDNCYKEFNTEVSFKVHQRSHFNKTHCCLEPNCSYKASCAALLRLHFKSVHSNIRPFVCEIPGCVKSYKTVEDLKVHVQRHSTERNFKCPVDGCGKTFKLQNDLNKHSKLHSGAQYKCDWPGCEHITKSQKCLSVHRWVHVSERNFPCNWPQCNKRFKANKDLVIHMRIHTNDRKYACSWPGCQYRCTDSGNLVKHRRVHLKV